MTARPSALSLSLAGLTLVAVLGLALRLGMQVSALSAVNGDLADARRSAAGLERAAVQGVGPPLIDAATIPATDALAGRLRAAGLEIQKVEQTAATPAGRDLALSRFVVSGRADPIALDRLSLWAEANQRSAVLEQLAASAGADGKSDVRVELDVLVRHLKAVAP